MQKLREIGIFPDVLCAARPAGAGGRKKKIALFTNVEQRAVISVPDVDTIFKVPQLLHDQMLDESSAIRSICWPNQPIWRRGPHRRTHAAPETRG